LRKYVLSINDKEYNAEVKKISTETATIIVDNKEYKIALKDIGRKVEPVFKASTNAAEQKVNKIENVKQKVKSQNTGNGVPAPLPGLITEILVKENAKVKSGQTIAVMEAMKMENLIQASHDGTVKKIFVKKGDSVAEGDIILEIERSVITSL